MSLNARSVQSVQNAQNIQGFALQNLSNPNPSTVMSVVVDDTKAQIHRRKTDLERYYQDASIQSTEIEVLGTEKDQLLKVLQELDPSTASKNWSLEDFQKAVRNCKKDWEGKDRMFQSKPHKFFLKIMNKFGAHKKVFSMVPSQNNYTSIVTGAATILVSAATQHVDTIEELCHILSVIDDAAAACAIEGEMYQSEAMQRAVAKFYIAVFLLLGDVAMWYKSSSWKKLRNSLSEGFLQKFTDALQNIQQLSVNVQRTAYQGANAEVRVTRLTVEELGLELNDIRIGLTGGLRLLAQQNWDLNQELLRHQQRSADQNKLDHEETRKFIIDGMSKLMRSKTFRDEIARNAIPLLCDNSIANQNQMSQYAFLSSGEQPENGHTLSQLMKYGVQSLPDMKASTGFVKIRDLQKYASDLLDYVQTGAIIANFTEEETPVFFDRRVVMSLEMWLRAKDSRLLYLESPSYISAAAMRIVLSAASLNIPCASFFCQAIEPDSENLVQNRGVDPLLGMVYSLIYQILNLLPPLKDQDLISSHERFTDLDGTISSWDRATELLKDTLKLAPALIILVVDGIVAFEEERELEIGDLIEVLRSQMSTHGRVLKVLFTSEHMVYSLTTDLEVDEMQIIDTGRQGGFGHPRIGQMTFVPSIDDSYSPESD